MPVRTFHHSAFTAERIAAERARRGLGVTVCLPARECAATVGEIVGRWQSCARRGAIDAIVVVDAASPDGTARVAEQAGAEVFQQAELLPSFGAVQGKGDAMWRALSRLDDGARVLPRRRHRGLLGALRHGPAWGRSCASRTCRS